MMVGTAALYLQVKKYSEPHDQRVQLRAPAQCNTAIYEDNLTFYLGWKQQFSVDLVSQWK